MSPGMGWPRMPLAAAKRVTVAGSLEEAVADAELVIESGPERIEVKLEVFAKLDAAARRRRHPRLLVVGHRRLALHRER